MQTFREEHNEKRIDKLEERLNVLETAVSNEWDHNTMIFKTIRDAIDTIQKITENLDGRVQRLEEEAKLMLMEANINGYTEGLKDSSKVEQKPFGPCDLCRFNPPSSADGKPCTMCPAESEEK